MHKTLHKGSKGRSVTMAQRELKRTVAPGLGVNGDFCKDTEDAVRLFQQTVGFTGEEINGEIGEKTTLALTQTFSIKLYGRARFREKSSVLSFGLPPLRKPDLGLAPVRPTPPAPVNLVPAAKPPAPETATEKAESSAFCNDKLQCNFQLGVQYSKRDHWGYQFLVGATLKLKDYFPNSGKDTFYHSANASLQPAFTLGLPFPDPVQGVLTGQFGITIQPITDWLVIDHIWHLFTPSLGLGYQGPFNPGQPVLGNDDTATHKRLGGTLGFELFHADINKKVSFGVSGQEAFYYDYKDHRFHWDPSFMGTLQVNFGGE